MNSVHILSYLFNQKVFSWILLLKKQFKMKINMNYWAIDSKVFVCNEYTLWWGSFATIIKTCIFIKKWKPFVTKIQWWNQEYYK